MERMSAIKDRVGVLFGSILTRLSLGTALVPGRPQGQNIAPAAAPVHADFTLAKRQKLGVLAWFHLRLRITPITGVCLVAPWFPGWIHALYPGLSRGCFQLFPSPAGQCPSPGAVYRRSTCPLFV